MTNEYEKNLINGMRWLPIQEKAMEILEEFEKRNKHDSLYNMGIGDILYYALALFYDDIISHDGDAHDLIKDVREEYIIAQERNFNLLGEFGHLETKFENKTEEMRFKKYGEWEGR